MLSPYVAWPLDGGPPIRIYYALKRGLLAGHRFGINARPNDAFGIAVAEMVKGGWIVFVPNGGGQVEIVNHPALIYGNEADATQKISAVLASDAEQESLRNHLLRSSHRFSEESFQGRIRQVVKDFLKERIGA
jgi:glycosyltransferase involved in cell wall biosynthesis